MPVAVDVGLAVSMFTYNGRALIGLVADLDLIPDLDRLSAHLSASLADLADSCGVPLNSS